MAFDWKKYLELARDLSLNEDEESFRSSISRGYYSIFNVLCGLVQLPNRVDKHQKLIELFKDINSHHLIEIELETEQYIFIANELFFLREKRNDADYDGKIKIKKELAEEILDKIEHIYEIIEK